MTYLICLEANDWIRFTRSLNVSFVNAGFQVEAHGTSCVWPDKPLSFQKATENIKTATLLCASGQLQQDLQSP